MELDSDALTIAPEATVTTALETYTVSPSRNVLLKLFTVRYSVFEFL